MEEGQLACSAVEAKLSSPAVISCGRKVRATLLPAHVQVLHKLCTLAGLGLQVRA